MSAVRTARRSTGLRSLRGDGDREAVDRLLSIEQPDAPRFWGAGHGAQAGPRSSSCPWTAPRSASTACGRPVRRRVDRSCSCRAGEPSRRAGSTSTKAVHGRAELWYLETREKASSRILNRRTDMGVGQAARDISRALATLGFAGRASCWRLLLGRGPGAAGNDRRPPPRAHGAAAGSQAPVRGSPLDPALGVSAGAAAAPARAAADPRGGAARRHEGACSEGARVRVRLRRGLLEMEDNPRRRPGTSSFTARSAACATRCSC